MSEIMKKITFSRLIQISLLVLICIIACSANVSAKSQKQKAMAAYKKMLSEKKFKYTTDSDEDEKRYQNFATAYINNDNIPELVVYDCLFNGAYGATLYTYKGGRVKKIEYLNFSDMYYYDKLSQSHVGYIKKGNVIRDIYADDFVEEQVSYLKISNGKLKPYPYYELKAYENYDEFYEGYRFTNISKKERTSKRIYAKLISKKSSYNLYTKVSQRTYNKKIKSFTRFKKFKKFEMHKNTASNRKKYLK